MTIDDLRLPRWEKFPKHNFEVLIRFPDVDAMFASIGVLRTTGDKKTAIKRLATSMVVTARNLTPEDMALLLPRHIQVPQDSCRWLSCLLEHSASFNAWLYGLFCQQLAALEEEARALKNSWPTPGTILTG